MKILFFLATLANLTYFFWQYNEGSYAFLATQAVEAVDNRPQQIQLVAEVKEKQVLTLIKAMPGQPLLDRHNTALAVNTPVVNSAPQTAVAETVPNVEHPLFKEPTKTQTPPDGTEKKGYCYLISGFASKAALESWLNHQPATTELTRKIKKNKITHFSYQVYYPAASSFAQSKNNLQIVKNVGIHDVFLIKEKPFFGDMSFGIFAEKDRAINRQQALIARGIYTLIRKRPKMMAVMYVGIKSEKNKKEIVDSLKGQANSFTIETVAHCK